MTIYEERRALHADLLDDVARYVAEASHGPLDLATPCAGWDLAALLSHMVGQNAGFAAAVGAGSAPEVAYAGPQITPANAVAAWDESAAALRASFARASPDDVVHLAELRRDVTAAGALAMQLLDTAVHAWDVATTLGQHYRPSEEVVGLVHDQARMIAARGGTPGVFAAPLDETGADAWADALRLLGRDAAA
ncbi:TIGR03086 family metal-binding protein [Xylanimonas sp. McL0601]|uniref:TIGR03086 family metal-binding protein n=1 Tax=Xylanimonas sp. McL0601 TaxID=3414739 RepID=UPI003CF09B68